MCIRDRGSASVSDEYICRYVGITPSELQMARKVEAMQAAPDPIQMMMQMADQMGGMKEAKPKKVDHLSLIHILKVYLVISIYAISIVT